MACVLITTITVCYMLTITHLWLSYNGSCLSVFCPRIHEYLILRSAVHLHLPNSSLVNADAQDFMDVMSIISGLSFMGASYYIRYTREGHQGR